MKLNPIYRVAIKKVPDFLKLNFMLFSSYERQKLFCFEKLRRGKKVYDYFKTFTEELQF